MQNKDISFYKGVFIGFFVFLALYVYSEPIQADSMVLGQVPWKPLYVKIVE